MPKRCARCGSLAGRGREVQVPNDWLEYLRTKRDVSPPVGRLKIPLCRDCFREVDALRDDLETGDRDVEDRNAMLDELDPDELIDEQT